MARHNFSDMFGNPVESWKFIWRVGVAPQLSTKGLEALRDALEKDDPRVLQGATTSPPPLQSVSAWPVEAACPIGFACWQGDGFDTVADVEDGFAQVCCESDRRTGEPADIRYFLNWADETPRKKMRLQLLEEVNLELAKRGPIVVQSAT